jgi:DNA-binding FrmR family transcriptional regulator
LKVIRMSHTLHNQARLIARVRRIRGQIEGIERALETAAGCAEVLRQLASARGALNGLTAQVMQDHLREHVVEAATEADRRAGGAEMIEVIRSYLK